MATPSGWSGSTNLLKEPGPHYHHALVKHSAVPLMRIEEDGSVTSGWSGKIGFAARKRFTVDDLIDYYYDTFGVVSPKLRRVTRSADRGAVASLLNEMSLDELLFAIDLMAEDYYAAGANRRPPLIAASHFAEGAIERMTLAKAHLEPILTENGGTAGHG